MPIGSAVTAAPLVAVDRTAGYPPDGADASDRALEILRKHPVMTEGPHHFRAVPYRNGQRSPPVREIVLVTLQRVMSQTHPPGILVLAKWAQR